MPQPTIPFAKITLSKYFRTADIIQGLNTYTHKSGYICLFLKRSGQPEEKYNELYHSCDHDVHWKMLKDIQSSDVCNQVSLAALTF